MRSTLAGPSPSPPSVPPGATQPAPFNGADAPGAPSYNEQAAQSSHVLRIIGMLLTASIYKVADEVVEWQIRPSRQNCSQTHSAALSRPGVD